MHVASPNQHRPRFLILMAFVSLLVGGLIGFLIGRATQPRPRIPSDLSPSALVAFDFQGIAAESGELTWQEVLDVPSGQVLSNRKQFLSQWNMTDPIHFSAQVQLSPQSRLVIAESVTESETQAFTCFDKFVGKFRGFLESEGMTIQSTAGGNKLDHPSTSHAFQAMEYAYIPVDGSQIPFQGSATITLIRTGSTAYLVIMLTEVHHTG